MERKEANQHKGVHVYLKTSRRILGMDKEIKSIL